MWSSNTLSSLSLEEVGVVVAEQELTRIEVNRVILVQISQVGKRQQGRNIRIIHKVCTAESIHFICKHFSRQWVIQNRYMSIDKNGRTETMNSIINLLSQFQRLLRYFRRL